ncbi:hypothetical protein GCM10010385_19630 [Streptomyces geysiriensis]|nr:hypothetical protein GCM10010385_19630 [Streptomyces geysiriensis]GGZ61172.1 hypothetical protein GCM10010301_37300 [Streptomyces plicatus]
MTAGRDRAPDGIAPEPTGEGMTPSHRPRGPAGNAPCIRGAPSGRNTPSATHPARPTAAADDERTRMRPSTPDDRPDRSRDRLPTGGGPR